MLLSTDNQIVIVRHYIFNIFLESQTYPIQIILIQLVLYIMMATLKLLNKVLWRAGIENPFTPSRKLVPKRSYGC